MNVSALNSHEHAVMASMKYAAVRAVRNREGELVYMSSNGPVSPAVVASLLCRRIITSVLDETRQAVYYRLTEDGRRMLILLPQTGPTNDQLQA